MTWLYVSVVTFWFSLLEVVKYRVGRLSRLKISTFKLIALVGTMIFAYEVFFNFSMWSALMSYMATTGDIKPDVLVNIYPNLKFAWNLTFATKLFTALTAMSLCALFFLQRIDSEKDKS